MTLGASKNGTFLSFCVCVGRVLAGRDANQDFTNTVKFVFKEKLKLSPVPSVAESDMYCVTG